MPDLPSGLDPVKSRRANHLDAMTNRDMPIAADRPIDTAPLNQVIGYRLRRAQLYVFQQFIDRFAEFELRPAEYSALSLIGDNPGRKQSEIAQILGIKRANFVVLINGLDQRGLTVRRQQPGDLRSHALFLTPKGKAFVQRANEVQAEFEAHCIQRLGGVSARDQLLALLEKLGG